MNNAYTNPIVHTQVRGGILRYFVWSDRGEQVWIDPTSDLGRDLANRDAEGGMRHDYGLYCECSECDPTPTPAEKALEDEHIAWLVSLGPNATCPLCTNQVLRCNCGDEDYSATPYEPFVPDFPLTNQHARANLLKSASIAALALFLSVTATHAAPDLTACFPAGTTGEGFPVVHCPLTDSTYYIDLDGSDGTLGHQDDGRWIELP
jgi:hypothetical protein